jgi:phage/plasmid-like protein (TIGR03299 family)
MTTKTVGTGPNIAVAQRDLPFLKYQVSDVVRPDVAGLLTVEATLEALGLDFDVESRKVYTHTQKGHRVTIPGQFANVRTDTEEVLGLVGDRYKVLQNTDALALGNVLMDTSDATIESGWSLRGGRQVGVTFRIPSADIAVPGDGGGFLQMFLMIGNSHDGNSSVSGHVGPVRKACTNMVRLFERSAVSSFKIRHTSGVEGKVAAMRDALGLTFRYKAAVEITIDKLMNTTLVESQVDAILQAAFPIKDDASDAQRENSVQGALLQNYLTSPTIDEIRGTGWGLLNSTNEYFEHLQPVRSKTFDRDSVRGISILQGTAYQSTNRVRDAILAAA